MTSWKDTVMSRERRKELIVARSRQQHVPESQEDMLLTKQAQLSFEAGEQSRTRLIADLQETVNRMMQDNSTLTVTLEQARTDERKAASQLVGRYLRQKVHYEEAVIAETRIMWLEEAILKGERP
jgi:hypothetical protein